MQAFKVRENKFITVSLVLDLGRALSVGVTVFVFYPPD